MYKGRSSRLSLSPSAQYTPIHLSDVLIVVMKRWKANGEKDNTTILPSNLLDIFDEHGNKIGQYSLEGFLDHHGSKNSGQYTAGSRRMVNDVMTRMIFEDERCQVLEKGKAESQARQPCEILRGRAMQTQIEPKFIQNGHELHVQQLDRPV